MALTRLFQVRLSDEQFAEIAKKAEDSGVSTAEWARNRLLGSTDVEIPVVQPPNPVVQEIMGDVLRLHPESITLVQEMTREEVAERYQGIKMHRVAFAAGEFPTTPIHSEVMTSAKDRAAAIMAKVPGMKPLSQINNPDYESPEPDQAGIHEDDEPEVDLMGELIHKWDDRLAKWRSRGETGQTEMVEELGQRVAAKLARVKPQLQAEFLASEVGEPA